MARMYPNQLINVTSPAEETLYEAFQDQLDNSYTVFHSVTWLGLDGDRRPRDGEADFVIAHPERGILIIEVKGGGIGHDPETDRWTSRDRSGEVHGITDPFYQARKSKYALLDELEKLPGASGHRLNIGYAVALPDILLEAALPGLDTEREMLLDRTDLVNVSAWVGRAYAYWRGENLQSGATSSAEVVSALMDMLGKAWELRPVLWGEFLHEQEILIQLTGEQYVVLDLLNRQRRACIGGCAGSGKTTLAVEKALRLSKQGFRVLFTCYNKALAAELRAKLQGEANLEVTHFHELCFELAKQAGIPARFPADASDAQKQHYFDSELPEALVKAADVLPDVRYDAIIADEGQDFQEDWWIPLQYLLHDPDGSILYIFYDDNQRLYDRPNALPDDMPFYSLSVNCRNTRTIHKQVMKFYVGKDSKPVARGPRGRPVEFVRFSDEEQFYVKLAALLEHLTFEEQVPNNEVVVLTPLRQNSRLWAKTDLGRMQLVEKGPLGANQIFATTIHSFKGLESAVIVLVEPERWPSKAIELENLLYVACSRARNHLIVLRPVLLSPALQKYFG